MIHDRPSGSARKLCDRRRGPGRSDDRQAACDRQDRERHDPRRRPRRSRARDQSRRVVRSGRAASGHPRAVAQRGRVADRRDGDCRAGRLCPRVRGFAGTTRDPRRARRRRARRRAAAGAARRHASRSRATRSARRDDRSVAARSRLPARQPSCDGANHVRRGHRARRRHGRPALSRRDDPRGRRHRADRPDRGRGRLRPHQRSRRGVPRERARCSARPDRRARTSARLLRRDGHGPGRGRRAAPTDRRRPVDQPWAALPHRDRDPGRHARGTSDRGRCHPARPARSDLDLLAQAVSLAETQLQPLGRSLLRIDETRGDVYVATLRILPWGAP